MEARDVWRKVGSGRQRRWNLYITRLCADVWKGTQQLVYEFTILSFSPSLPLSISRAVRFVSISFGLAFSHFLRSCLWPSDSVLSSCPFHSDCASVPFGLVLVSVPFGLYLRYIRFSLRVPYHSVLVYAAAY